MSVRVAALTSRFFSRRFSSSSRRCPMNFDACATGQRGFETRLYLTSWFSIQSPFCEM